MTIDFFMIGWGIVEALLLFMLTLLIVNLLTFPRLALPHNFSSLEKDREGAPLPLLSILIPVRNEEECIETCVRSLIAQDYEALEVLVLDDQSNDATGTIVQRIIDELPTEQTGRLCLLRGTDVLQGWVGKNFACYQLAQQARGDYLLFTDADTVHAPEMARSVITCMQRYSVKLLTALPTYEMESLGERLIVPLLAFTILTLLPVALVRLRPESSLATGNGQLLCFHRSAYDDVGGHAAVRDRILEDVLLARAVKAAGYQMIYVDATKLVRCRMYRSFAEVWAGFSKNLFAFYNYSLPFGLLALFLNLALYVFPLCFALLATVLRLPLHMILPGVIAYVLTVVMRVILALRFEGGKRDTGTSIHGMEIWTTRGFPNTDRITAGSQGRAGGPSVLLCLFHPISVVLECLILLNSIRWRYRKAGTTWKGRQYRHNPARQ